MLCPRCHIQLKKILYDQQSVAYECSVCHGIALTMAGLRNLGVSTENSANIWKAALKKHKGCVLPCPECRTPMSVVKLDDGEIKFEIDVCTKCHIIWFDPGELEHIPLVPPQEKSDADLPDKAREILALHEISKVKAPEEPVTVPYRLGSSSFNFSSSSTGYGEIICAVLNLIIRMIVRRYIGF